MQSVIEVQRVYVLGSVRKICSGARIGQNERLVPHLPKMVYMHTCAAFTSITEAYGYQVMFMRRKSHELDIATHSTF